MCLAAASHELEQAHRALGLLYASTSLDEFAIALKALVASARSALWWTARLGVEHAPDLPAMSEADRRRRRAFAGWLAIAEGLVSSHPLATCQKFVAYCGSRERCELAMDLDVDLFEEAAHDDGLADSGSAPELRVTKLDEIRLDLDQSRAAIQVCADYLDRVTTCCEHAKREARRAGLVGE